MKSKKSTGELLHEIATTKQNFESFANENKDEFDEFDSRDYLNRLLVTKNLQPTDIIRRSGLDRSYVYHIIMVSGKSVAGQSDSTLHCI